MDSPADGSYCGFVCMETLARGGGTRTLNASPNQRFCVISKRQVSHVETRFDLIGASGKPHMLILETRPLMRDSRKPKQWTPLGLGPCPVQPHSLGTSIYSMSGHGCSAGFRQPLFVLGVLCYWDGLGDFGGFP